MNVLITGGTGLIGRALTRSLLADGHKVWILTRAPARVTLPLGCAALGWDGRTAQGWGELVNEMDAVVNLAGVNTASWPWTPARKQSFWNSRVWAGQAVAEAVRLAKKKPAVLIQSSGINHYGLRGKTADESTPSADDFLARLTVAWEFSSQPVEELGVRRVVICNLDGLRAGGGTSNGNTVPAGGLIVACSATGHGTFAPGVDGQ